MHCVACSTSSTDAVCEREQDYKDGSFSQVTASAMDTKWREDFERMKKARVHRCAHFQLTDRPLLQPRRACWSGLCTIARIMASHKCVSLMHAFRHWFPYRLRQCCRDNI
jgi:hypothetical protein